MNGSKSMIAPCGINCSECEIHLAPDNPGTAEKVTKWIRENHNPKCTVDMIPKFPSNYTYTGIGTANAL